MPSSTAHRILLTDVRIVGGDGEPVDLLLADGRIADGGEVPAVERVEADGRYVMPGLWDHHVHFAQWALVRSRLDVLGAPSAAATAAIVEARARAESVVEAPLVGFGFRSAGWPDAPTADALDRVSPERPVVLLSGDMHGVWLNSAAARRYGVAPGHLREEAAFAVQRRLETQEPGMTELRVSEAAAEAAARGVVGIVDLDMAPNDQTWTSRVQAGVRALRVVAGFYPEQLDEVLATGRRAGESIPGTGGLVTQGPLKLITDGSLNTHTAFCDDPYPGTHERGVLNYSPAQVMEFLNTCAGAGLHAAVHAIGDAALTHALDAFESSGARGTIEHAQFVHERDLHRFGDLGVVASVQPEHLWDDRTVAAELWRGRASLPYPWRALADAGATLRLGSDAPVAPLDPWCAVAAAVHRSPDEAAPWHPEQALTVPAALDAATGGRRVAPGAVADLAILDSDPLASNRDGLVGMPVAATLLGGEFTHRTF